MKPSQMFLIAGVALFFPVSASARIGESPTECVQRYGWPVKAGTNRMWFLKGGLRIYCRFWESRCVAIFFAKEERDASDQPIALSDTEIETLLKENGGGHTWKAAEVDDANKNFYTEELMASHEIGQRSLFITTQEAVQRYGKEASDKKKGKLEGS